MVNDIYIIEWGLHALLFSFAIVALTIMYVSYRKISKGELRRIVGCYWFAFFFSALRWFGGSLARIQYDFTNTLLFNIFWAGAGVISGIFGIYGAYLLLKFSRVYGFVKGKSVQEKVCPEKKKK